MESKHTPGPWNVCRIITGGLFITNSTGKLSVCNSIHGATNHEVEANARLIASAPELLSALRAIVPSLEVRLSSKRKDVEAWDILNIAREAIARATGKGEE